MRARFGVIRAFARPARSGPLLLLCLLVGVFVASAQAATSTKFYSVTISPTATMEVGQSASRTITLSNLNTSTQTLGSANVTVPAGFTLPPGTGCLAASAVTAPAGKAWTVCYVAGNLQFRAVSSKDALAPNSSVSATLTVTAAAVGDWTWVTEAKQSNSFSGPPGNGFVRTGSDPVLRVVGRVCKPGDASCVLSDGQTTAETAVPTSGTIEMTLLSAAGFNCNGQTVTAGSILRIDAPSATANYTVTLTYAGVTGQLDVCKSTDGVTYQLLSDCNATTPKNDPPCVQSDTGGSGGRQVVVLLGPGDPYVAGG